MHVLFNVMGAALWLPFIPQLAAIAQAVSPVATGLQGVEQLAAEVPRQIANAATLWAVANTAIFLPFAAAFAKLATRIVPDRAVQQKQLIQPAFLDHEVVQVPAMAFERSRMELGHMSELTEGMLAQDRSAFESGGSCELSRQGDQVRVLRDAVLDRLRRIHGVAEDMALSVLPRSVSHWRTRLVARHAARPARVYEEPSADGAKHPNANSLHRGGTEGRRVAQSKTRS